MTRRPLSNLIPVFWLVRSQHKCSGNEFGFKTKAHAAPFLWFLKLQAHLQYKQNKLFLPLENELICERKQKTINTFPQWSSGGGLSWRQCNCIWLLCDWHFPYLKVLFCWTVAMVTIFCLLIHSKWTALKEGQVILVLLFNITASDWHLRVLVHSCAKTLKVFINRHTQGPRWGGALFALQ